MLSRPGTAGLRDLPGDAGMTLVELLVGMVLMTVLGGLVLNFFVGTTAQANRVSEQSLVGASARAAMTQIVKTLQVADTPTANAGYSTNRIVYAGPTEITFYSNISATGRSGSAVRSAPTLVDFTLTNGTLWESLWAPQNATTAANYPTTTAPTSKNSLATNLTNQVTNPAVPVFTYCSDATDPASSCTATSSLPSIAMVQVALVVQKLNGTAASTVRSGVAIQGQIS